MYRIGDISTGIKVKPLPSKGLVFLPPILFLEHPTALIIVKMVKKKCTYSNSRHQTHWHSYPLQLHHYLRWVVEFPRERHKISRIIGRKSTQSKEPSFWPNSLVGSPPTPARTHSIIELKSRVMKLPFLT